MRVTIRPLTDADVAPVVAFSLAAWLPVFEGIEAELGPEVHRMLFPDWRSAQAQVITALCTAPDTDAWVAVVDDRPIGVVVVREIDEDAARAGEIALLGVDPAHQGAGVGSSLVERALAEITGAGLDLAVVATGGDPGHAPARALYEKLRFNAFRHVRYYRKL